MTNLSIRVHMFITSLVSDIKNERGQDLIEYALLGGIIAVGLIAVGIFFKTPVENMILGIGRCIDFTAGGCTTDIVAGP